MILFILLSSYLHAQSVEISGPRALTYHPVFPPTCTAFASRLSKDGCLIDNQQYSLALSSTYNGVFSTHALLIGTNSMGGTIFGGFYERGYERDGLQIGYIIGAYYQDSRPYTNAGYGTLSLSPGKDSITPVLGMAVNYKISLGNDVYLKINNVISTIINSSLGLGFTF